MALTKVSYSMIEGAVLNVLDFGAIGDGVTDDTSAIQDAIDSLGATGGEIFFPSGTYSITNLIVSNVASIALRGTGATTFLCKSAYSTFALTLESSGTFGRALISDIDFSGTPNTISACAISGRLMHNCEFRNMSFKWFQTIFRGENVYASTFDNLEFDEFQIGIRGLTPAEATARGYSSPDNAPIADNFFSNLNFIDGSDAVVVSYALQDTGFNSNHFNACIFAGVNLHGIDLTNGYGGNTFTGCRFERMKARVSWIKLNSFNYFYNCVAYTDGGNTWWTPANPADDTWLFDIQGDSNYIDGVTPEYPWHIFKLRDTSSTNSIKWIPAISDSSFSGAAPYFVMPIVDEGYNNTVNVGNTDSLYNGTNAASQRSILNVLVGTNDQSCFTLSGLTQTYAPTDFSKGPYQNESVYKYALSGGGTRTASALVTGLVAGYWYTYSMWVNTYSKDALVAVECIAGDSLSDAEAYATYEPGVSSKWVRIFKTFLATDTDMYCGLRMSASATTDLYVSQPQLTECGSLATEIVVGAYVPTTDAIAQCRYPNINTARNLVDKASSRSLGTTYTNTNGKPIDVYVSTASSTVGAACRAYINGILVFTQQNTTSYDVAVTMTVNPGETYSVSWSAGGSVVSWYENI